MKSCFFIGHREASTEIFPILTEAVELHIAQFVVREFIVGNYGGFDRMAAKAVIASKAQYPEITLSLMILYHPSERPAECPAGFDNTFYPLDMERVPRRLAIIRANRYMVDHVDYLIAYAWHPASNARNLLELVVFPVALFYHAYNAGRPGSLYKTVMRILLILIVLDIAAILVIVCCASMA